MNTMALRFSVIISTYNQPEWLHKVLCGYEHQTYPHFEILVADDGSGPETKAVVEAHQSRGKNRIRHVWHEDNGFQKTAILNKATVAAAFEYLLFTDGDCIPRADFLATHAHFAKPGYFLSGGYCKLPMQLSKAITEEDIAAQRCFSPSWLKERGLKNRSALRKLRAKGWKAALLDWATPTNASFNGCNTSVWKADVMAVNGADERMQYGGEDRELGERLFNYGIQSRQIRHRAVLAHLDHARGYATQESIDRNEAIRKETRKNRTVRTAYGIEPAR
ncbi:glycosyltransferase family 2 protein [Phaeodactylibacter luteus]|uniref:Glycosyltransferase n=1 Tax=Phaeodactylibacter luteus TaxID=1564516 RepID=A0A5C6RQB2_9BACT|nr:glycosyltransferase family 2 protein [Phaeodactylibacter luteus]TXB64144.1 glycosyltransferase [Phaeodactylibacter luteus]